MSHGALHLIDVEGIVAAHHKVDIPVIICESFDADVLKPAVGDVSSERARLFSMKKSSGSGPGSMLVLTASPSQLVRLRRDLVLFRDKLL